MTGKKFYHFISIIINHLKNPYYQGFAAQMAFYFVLSIVPIVVVLSQMLGLVSLSLNVLDELVREYASEEFVEITQDFLTYVPSGPMNIFFVLIALWSASRTQFAMVRLANYTMTEGQSAGRGYFRDRLRAYKTILFTLFTVTFTLVVLVYGELILMLFKLQEFWLYIRWPVAFALYFLMVCYNFYALPYEKVKFRDILPGSLFSSIGMLVVTIFYSGYMKYIGGFDIIYGSLATSVALIIWFFILSWALVLGVLLNKAFCDIMNE